MYSCSSCIRLPILTCRSEKIPVRLWAARATGVSCFVVHGFTHSPLLPNSFVFLSLVVYQPDQATRTLNIHPMDCLELHACIFYIVYGDVDNSHSLPSNQLLGHVVTSPSTKDEKWKTLIVWKLGNKWCMGSHSPPPTNSFVFLSLVVYQADQATRTLNIHPMGCLELHACIIYIVYGDVDNSHSLPSNQLLGHVVTSSSTKDEKWKTLIVWKLGNKWFHG
jgi:NAD-dependent dihydropyrimidine dehydrogenase PreA subunit